MAIGWLWGSSQADGKSSVLKNEAGGESGAVQSSGCPVKMGSGPQVVVKGDQVQSTGGACPVPEDRRADHPMMIMLDPRNNMRAGGESQYPGLGQKKPLSRNRVESSIPREEFMPAHQADTGSEKWVYPSEQMFFNAMQRKGWEPSEDDMQSVVAIHNAVNERSWSEVMKWEKELHPECGNPKLVRFYGRPKDFSPRARMMGLMGYKMPFDRHDWTVDRCGKKVRYVVDFYNGKPSGDSPVSFHLDVRPALDDYDSIKDRLLMAMKPWLRMLGSSGQVPAASTASK